MDKINLIISVLALVIAIATAFAAHYYHIKGDQKYKREILLEIIRSIDGYQVISADFIRERKKTGAPISAEDNNTFTVIETVNEKVTALTEVILPLLSNKSKISDELLYTGQLVKKHVDSLSIMLDSIRARLLNYNNNRLPELAKKLEAYKELLEQFDISINKET